MVNFGALRDEIATDIVRNDIDTQIEEAIREAITEFETETFTFNQGKDTTQTFTVGSPELALPTGAFKIRDFKVVIDSNFKPSLRPRTLKHIQQANSTPSFIGRPSEYCIDRGLLIVSPIPDSTYATEILSFITSTLPVAPADTHVLIDDAKNMIKFKAESLLYFTVLFDDANGKKFEKLAGGPDIENPQTGKLLGAYGRLKKRFNFETESLMIGLS